MADYLADCPSSAERAGHLARPCASMASFISFDMTSGPRMRSKATRSSRSTVVGTTAVTVAARLSEERSDSSPAEGGGAGAVQRRCRGCRGDAEAVRRV